MYESRGPTGPLLGGGLVLSPNAIRILKPLGVYHRILDKGYQLENTEFVTEQGQVLDRHYYGHERMYGCKALRISRKIFLDELKALCEERNDVELRYYTRFERVVQDTAEGVAFQVSVTQHANSTAPQATQQTETADLLIGADGIHSNLRKYLSSMPLAYTGLTAIVSQIPRSEIRWSRPDHPTVSTVRGENGAFILIPEDPEARMTMAGIQRSHPELNRAGWDALQADRGRLKDMLMSDYETWGDISKSIIESMCRHNDTLVLWPYYKVPALESWASETRRVAIVGDSAHAIPPSSGQGVCQAIEDVYSLAYLLNAVDVGDNITLDKAIDFWQRWRMDRIRKLERLEKVMNIKRMPAAERKSYTDVLEEDLKTSETDEGRYAWLFKTNFDRELGEWVTRQQCATTVADR